MPTSDPYAQSINLAALTDAPDVETLAHGIVDAAVQRLVLRFTSATHRAATLVGAAAPVPGMITYLAAEDRYEARMGDGTWRTISSGAWIPLSFASGYAARTGSPSYRILGDSVELRGTLERTTAAPFAKGTALTVATLPVGARPAAWKYFPIATEWAADMYARAEVDTAGHVIITIPPSTATGASWASLDNVKFSLST
ncbi:hypothetical protein [Streptomyces zaomyceticus]|uniref:hypothetical protein n=1 Tax=Streptomyces zaomyceticus TaxID=68286 RepID=UPI002E144EA2|nr:hypothetical protein OG237_15975 [Streptomyces zaomyceticus]